MSPATARPPSARNGGGIGLDGLAYGIEGLEAIVAFQIADASVKAAWVRKGSGFTASAIATSLREVYKTSQVHARRLDFLSPSTLVESDGGDLSDPVVTLEMPGRVAMLRRIRAYVVAAFFDATLPLGFVRLQSARIAAVLKPELPDDTETPPSGSPAVSGPPPTAPSAPPIVVPIVAPTTPAPPVVVPVSAPVSSGPISSIPSTEEPDLEEPARTLAFPTGGAVVVRSSRPAPRGTPAEIDRAKKLLAYLDKHAPDPHVVRLRVALRAGIKPLSLDHPESLGADAMVLLETAAEDILGIDRAELRSLL
jgi:hypothetical protein